MSSLFFAVLTVVGLLPSLPWFLHFTVHYYPDHHLRDYLLYKVYSYRLMVQNNYRYTLINILVRHPTNKLNNLNYLCL